MEVFNHVLETVMQSDYGEVTDAVGATWTAIHMWGRLFRTISLKSALYVKENPEVGFWIVGIILSIILIRILLRLLARAWAYVSNSISTRYRSFLSFVESKSRPVAMVLPHILFFAAFYYITSTFPSTQLVLRLPSVALIVTVVLPILFAAQSLQKNNQADVEHWKKYFTVISALSIISQLPFIGMLIDLIPGIAAVRVAAMWWIVCPFVGAVSTTFALLTRFLLPFHPIIPRNFNTGLPGMVLSMVVSVGVMTEARKTLIANVLEGGMVAIVAMPFFFSFDPVTRMGALMVGVLFPATLSVSATPAESRDLLKYWILYALLDLALPLITSLPFSSHLRIVTYVWLQLPYFHGAVRIFSLVMSRSDNSSAAPSAPSTASAPSALKQVPAGVSKDTTSQEPSSSHAKTD